MNATFEASGSLANIDSPKYMSPSDTPYSPPTSVSPRQASTLCAWPIACSPA